jgi:hypothetical protein
VVTLCGVYFIPETKGKSLEDVMIWEKGQLVRLLYSCIWLDFFFLFFLFFFFSSFFFYFYFF